MAGLNGETNGETDGIGAQDDKIEGHPWPPRRRGFWSSTCGGFCRVVIWYNVLALVMVFFSLAAKGYQVAWEKLLRRRALKNTLVPSTLRPNYTDIFDNISFVNLTVNQNLTKALAIRGSERRKPGKNAIAYIDVIGYTDEGHIFLNTRNKRELAFQIKRRRKEVDLPLGLHLGVMSMEPDERSLISMTPEYAFNETGAANRNIPFGCRVIFDVELWYFVDESDAMEEVRSIFKKKVHFNESTDGDGNPLSPEMLQRLGLTDGEGGNAVGGEADGQEKLKEASLADEEPFVKLLNKMTSGELEEGERDQAIKDYKAEAERHLWRNREAKRGNLDLAQTPADRPPRLNELGIDDGMAEAILSKYTSLDFWERGTFAADMAAKGGFPTEQAQTLQESLNFEMAIRDRRSPAERRKEFVESMKTMPPDLLVKTYQAFAKEREAKHMEEAETRGPAEFGEW